MLLIGMCTSLTKKPTKPMIKNPIIVADAIRANSFLSGFVHFLTRWIESCVWDASVSLGVAATARRVSCDVRLATAAAAQ